MEDVGFLGRGSRTPTPVRAADSALDGERFRHLYEATCRDIEAYCRRRLAPEFAEAAVSEVFLTAWRRLDDVPEPPDERLWLFGVARRVVATARRAERRRTRLETKIQLTTSPADSVVSDEMDGVDDRADAVRRVAVVLSAAETLSETDAEILRLVAWEQLTLAGAAVVLDISPGTAKVRLHRARRRLEDALTAAEANRASLSPPPTSGHVSDTRAAIRKERT